MSLIVTTSRVNENSGAAAIGTEKPGDYTNFFRSPILIEKDSEVAVDSVKIQRTGNVTLSEDNFFTHFFGADPDDFAEGTEYSDMTSVARKIRMPMGSKSLAGYQTLVQKQLNDQYDDPRIYGGGTVLLETGTDGSEQGLSIKFKDRGSASTATSNVTASLQSNPVFNIINPNNASKSDNYAFVAGTGVLTRTGTSASKLNDTLSVAMLTGRPFGLNEGKFQFNCSNASAQPWAIGLSRPQIQVTDVDGNTFPIDTETGSHRHNDTAILDVDGDNNLATTGPHELYDYAVMLDDNEEIIVTNRVWDNSRDVSIHQEISYWTTGGTVAGAKLTKTAFYASYDGIAFEGDGDNMSIYFKQKGKAGLDLIVAISLGTGNTAITALRPIGSTTTALYPMIHLGAGNITVTKYDSNFVGTNDTFKFPEWTGVYYLPGSDMFSNEALEPYESQSWVRITNRALSRGSILHCDSSQQKVYVESILGLDPAAEFTIVGLNASNGVDYKHILTVGKFNTSPYDTLVESQEYPNMSFKLGFADRSLLRSTSTDGYVTGDGTLTVVFTSTGELDKTSLSSFIRLPGLTHTSYNGGQSGISKIVYQVPQFSNDGRQFGPLFFQPGEKTYVKLNNPGAMILNQLQVQFVDANERNTDSLMGETQVVFHIRKSR